MAFCSFNQADYDNGYTRIICDMSKKIKFTEVLVLGVSHLTKEVNNSALDETVKRLKAWQPDAVGIETVPGYMIESYQKMGKIYQNAYVGGIWNGIVLGEEARKYRDWSRYEAERLALDLKTDQAERVMAWLVALEPMNALLHWQSDLDLPEKIQELLHKISKSPSETQRIALPVAAALGHQRLHMFDDFTTNEEINKRVETVMMLGVNDQNYKDKVDQSPAIVESNQRLSSAITKDDYWEYLKYSNSQQGIYNSEELEIGLKLKLNFPDQAERVGIADWNTRNMFMAAHLRMITAMYPSGRVLAIVGAAHKGPIEAVLKSISPDIRIVKLEELENA